MLFAAAGLVPAWGFIQCLGKEAPRKGNRGDVDNEVDVTEVWTGLIN
jgi:hypothetical protein